MRSRIREVVESSAIDRADLVRKLTRIEEIDEKIQGVRAALDNPLSVIIGHIFHFSNSENKGIKGSKMDWALIECVSDEAAPKVKNERPDMDRAPRQDPRSFKYMDKCDYRELAKLDYKQWICYQGSTSGIRSGYTNGMRTYVNKTYEIEGPAADFPIMSDYVALGWRIPRQRIMYAGKLARFARVGDSDSAVWNEEGDMVGLLWGDVASGASVTGIDEVMGDVKGKTGMDLEPIREE